MKKVVLLVLIFCLSIVSSAFAKEKPNQSTDEKRMISVEYINADLEKRGMKKLKQEQIPTVKQVNEALKKVSVSKDNPVETIDLGNGFAIEVSVSETNSASTKLNSSIISPLAVQNTTATGTIKYTYLGINYYTLTVSDNYSYDSTAPAKIISFQNPPSATASAIVGYEATVTNKYISSIDQTAKDAIADATYKYLKIGGTVAGHIELRFTATGNYYVHDSYFQ